jgi:DNA repair photolyase
VKVISGTKEWSSSSVNVMSGCANDCKYCYAKADAIRFQRCTHETWKDETPRAAMIGKQFGKRKGTVMFPTTHDITPSNLEVCKEALHSLIKAGNKVLVVSKAECWTIESLCRWLINECPDLYPPNPIEQVLFRFTIGSMDPRTLKYWEPGAPSFASRLYALMWCFFNGWETSVSMEPMLDVTHRSIIQLVETVAPFVTDSIWLGKLNSPGARMTLNLNGMDDEDKQVMRLLCSSQSDELIKDLYDKLKGHPKVKWKESIKKVVGLPLETEAGTDR